MLYDPNSLTIIYTNISEKRRLFSESVGAKRLLDDGECHP